MSAASGGHGGINMKKLGLVGGMGPESTIPYYHDIAYGVQERTRKDFFIKYLFKEDNHEKEDKSDTKYFHGRFYRRFHWFSVI